MNMLNKVCAALMAAVMLCLVQPHGATIIVRGPMTPASSTAPEPDILWWKANDGSGATVTADVGPNSTDFNGTWIANGSGYALELDGTDYATASSDITFGTNSISVSFWIRATSWESGGTGRKIITSSGGSGDELFEISNSYDQIYGVMASGASYKEQHFAVPSTNTWHHVVMVLEKTSINGTFTFYLNGSSQSTTGSGSGNLATSNYSNRPYRLGEGTVGRIDDMRIYSGVLTSDDVSAIYAAGAQ